MTAAAISDEVHEWLGLTPALRLVIDRLAPGWESNQIAGICIGLFLLAIHTLFRRRKNPGIKLLIIASCVMAILGTAQMAVNIAVITIFSRFVRLLVHVQALNQPGSVNTLLTVQYTMLGINK
jgi:hypothetical protein